MTDQQPEPQTVAGAAAHVATSALRVMQSTPLAIALLIINIAFLAFCGYVLGEVAQNSSERNKAQMDLIAQLVRDCRSGARPMTYDRADDAAKETSPTGTPGR